LIEFEERCLSLICSPQGMITQVMRNDLDISGIEAGCLFSSAVESSSRFKALNLLKEINTHLSAFGWEINYLHKDQFISLIFCGGQTGDQVLLVGAVNEYASNRIYKETMRIINEQTNLLRDAIKQNKRLDSQIREAGLYDEISRLNNELVSTQRQLIKKNAELEHLNRLKNQFLGMAAHDLRNPLHAISSYSHLLLDADIPITSEEQVEFINEISSLSEYMLTIVNDLLSVSVIESGQLNLNLKAVNLSGILENNIKRNRFLAARKQIQIDLEFEPVPELMLDAFKIEQVLDNLLSNAIKFSQPGTCIQVKLTPQQSGVTISVQDQGHGMSDSEMQKLFAPFARLKASGISGEPTIGLGLFIAKRIVEGHAGKIWVESEVDKGTTFFVFLPYIANRDDHEI
jgi:two-component system, OmpR family, sensor kinase